MASDMSDFDPTTSTDSDNSCLFKIQKAVTCKDDSFFFQAVTEVFPLLLNSIPLQLIRSHKFFLFLVFGNH